MSLNQNNDDEFLSLLSAQREILKRLNREKSFMANKRDEEIAALQTGELTTSLPTMATKHGVFAVDSDQLYSMNEPITERRLRQNGSLHNSESPRISGFGILPTCPTVSSTAFLNGKRANKRQKIMPIKPFQMDATTSARGLARHKNSLCGMLATALVFDTDLPTTRASSKVNFYHTREADNSSVFVSNDGFRRKIHLDSNIDVNFVLAMEKSMKSQQDIHDWDRKMGLKRSHSKTMRLSMRSRNRLRKVVSTNV